MKLATYRWNLAIVGHKKPIYYYGYKTKKEAQAFADKWNTHHDDTFQIYVIDTKKI